MIPFLKYVVAKGGTAEMLKCEFTGSKGITNPSIIRHNGKILLSLRSCEYTFFNYKYGCDQNGQNISWYPMGIYKEVPVNFLSKNYICEFDEKTFAIKNNKEILHQDERELIYNGAEDIRLFTNNGRLCASYSVYENGDYASMNITEFDDSYEVVKTEKHNPEKWEKNWMPVIGKGECFVRKAFGDIVEIKNGKLEHHGDIDAPLGYRGSTQLWPYKDGYVCMVHSNFVFEKDNVKSMQYMQKFLFTDKDYNVVKESEWFVFIGMPIEFTCGMLVEGEDVLIPFSIFDSCSFIIKTKMENIISYTEGDNADFESYKINSNELHDIAITKSGNDFLKSIDKYVIENCGGNSATKIACMTHLGMISENKSECKEMYVRALCEVKNFGIEMGNAYMHMLIGQDMIRDAIEKIYKNN